MLVKVQLERQHVHLYRRIYGQAQMAAKQSRIEKLKLEIRRLEAERDGLKQARKAPRYRQELGLLSVSAKQAQHPH